MTLLSGFEDPGRLLSEEHPGGGRVSFCAGATLLSSAGLLVTA